MHDRADGFNKGHNGSGMQLTPRTILIQDEISYDDAQNVPNGNPNE